MKQRLLLVEDEPGLVVTLSDRFRAAGYEVAVATTGPEGLDRAQAEPFDLVVLDLMLPGISGLEVCHRLRSRSLDPPILMLTALGEVVDRVVGLRVGADDYLPKPFATAELLARVEALIRRSRPAATGAGARPGAPEGQPLADPFRFGEIEVRFRQARVLRNGREMHLTHRMFRLLRVLIERRGEALSRDQLLDAAWGPEATPAARTVDVHVSWLRQRLEPDPRNPRFLQTVRGIGYRFDP